MDYSLECFRIPPIERDTNLLYDIPSYKEITNLHLMLRQRPITREGAIINLFEGIALYSDDTFIDSVDTNGIYLLEEFSWQSRDHILFPYLTFGSFEKTMNLLNITSGKRQIRLLKFRGTEKPQLYITIRHGPVIETGS